MHSVKIASQITGLSTDTLRAWERRHGVVHPRRDAGGRRVYDDADIARLRLLQQVVALGHSIQRIAPLSDDDLEKILATVHGLAPAQPAADLVRRILDAVEAYRPDLCDEALGLAIALLSPRDALRHVLAPALVEAGERWHRSQWSAAQEHLLTASTERLVMVTMHAYQKTARGPGIVFGTLTGERHVLGGLLAAFLAASQGLRCCYLGPDLPPEELAQAAHRSGASVVALSIVDASETTTPIDQIIALCHLLGKNIQVWLGGRGTENIEKHTLPSQCLTLKNFDMFVERAKILRDTQSF